MDRTLYFSVVIPVYNKAPHVARSINSVLKQTLKNFELLIINDASTDGSDIEIQKYNDPRIRLFNRNEPGPGGYAARNLGIREAKAGWIAFIDADDEWLPNHLEKMYLLSINFPYISFMGCGWQTKSKAEISCDSYYNKYKTSGPHTIDFNEYFINCMKNMRPVWTSVVCIKKNDSINDNLFPANLGAKRGGDLHAWRKLMCHYKKMGWSNHIGAIYNKDSVNMVTKTAPSSMVLLEKDLLNDMTVNLSMKENTNFNKYINNRLKNIVFRNAMKDINSYYIIPYIRFKGNVTFSLLLIIISLLPSKIIRFMLNNRKIFDSTPKRSI